MQNNTPQKELYIFPCRDKRPLTPEGFKNARVESQWTGKESNQWGLSCGERNGVFVVDVDATTTEDEPISGVQFHETRGTDWGDSYRVPTPSGGYHVYYQFDPRVSTFNNAVRIECGTDFRTNGGYVILYAELDRSKIKSMPDSLFKHFQACYEERRKNLKTSDSSEAVEGGRNSFLTRQAGRMQKLDVLTFQGLMEINENRCVPPLDESEVRTIFESVSRYAPDIDDEELDQPEAKAQDLIGPMIEHLSNDAAVKGESTGIPHLDNLLGGGKRLGELSVMLAEAKSGKNTFWHYQMLHMLDRGIPLAYASRELDPATEVMPNLVTLALGRNIYKMKAEKEAILDRIKGWSLVFSEGIGQYNDVTELFLWIEAKIKEGIKFFWVDHLHFCLPDPEDFKALSNFIRALRTIARTNMVHIDLIIQPKGGTTQHNKSGKLIDNDLDIGQLRGGASLGQALDNLITMQRIRDEDGDKTDVSKISLKTSRNKLAKLGSFYAQYDRDTMRFSEVPKPSEPDTEDSGENRYHKAARRNKTTKSPQDVPVFDLSQNGFNLRKGL